LSTPKRVGNLTTQTCQPNGKPSHFLVIFMHSRPYKSGRMNGRSTLVSCMFSWISYVAFFFSCSISLAVIYKLFMWNSRSNWWCRWKVSKTPRGVWFKILWYCDKCFKGNHDIQPKWEVYSGGSLELHHWQGITMKDIVLQLGKIIKWEGNKNNPAWSKLQAFLSPRMDLYLCLLVLLSVFQ